jgi:hypothetical protein
MYLKAVVDSIRVSLKLSAQRALLGNVPKCLRSASLDINDSEIVWKCVFDNDAIDSDFELLSMAGTEIISDFTVGFSIKEIFEVIPYPQKINHLKWVVYSRYER